MKRKWRSITVTVMLVLVVVISIHRYNSYIGQKFYQESTEHLLSTYEQVNKTFLIFTQRNWNVLTDWGSYLKSLSEQENPEEKWRDFVEEGEKWQYSELYVFNEECQYRTVSGRQGTAEHMRDSFEQLYSDRTSTVSSYTSSKGIRKVMFAVPIDPIIVDGVTYTGLAVSYDNNVMEEMIGGKVYGGASDCYVIDPDGAVLMSIEPKTEIAQKINNIFEFLEKSTDWYDSGRVQQMKKDVVAQKRGSVSYRYEGSEYYLVYQPVGIQDWSIVGIVDQSVVNSGMRSVQYVTIILLTVLTVCIALLILAFIIREAKIRANREKREREELVRRKELTDQLFDSMARIVDRFCVCDLKNNSYEYHERRGAPIYPENGKYEELVEKISERYTVLTDGENAKITNMLSVENVRTVIQKKEDIFKFEYCARDKSSFQIMNVIPVEWEDTVLTKIILVAQDMGQQHELENLANTDALTGLFNKRYFSMMMKIRQEKKTRFALFYMDLDRFKPVNDTYGHDMGDKLLREVAHRLQGCIRSHDYAFRVGGDEFALIINGNMNEQLCVKRIERIKKEIRAPYFIDGQTIFIGISCGSAVYPDDGADMETIQNLADQRMYADKKINHERAGISIMSSVIKKD